VRFGINLLNFGGSCNAATLCSSAATAEELGFHLLAVSDHLALTPEVTDRYPAPFYEALTTLTFLAARTSRVQLGTTVVVAPYRHPLLLARCLTTLDQLSDERLVLGVGVGWARSEFDALGVDFSRRGTLTDECLTTLLETWATDAANPPSAPGARVERAHPPLWIAGNGRSALRRAVRFGDAWHPIDIDLPTFRRQVELLDDLARKAGRPRPALAPRLRAEITEHQVAGPRRAGLGSLEQIHSDLTELKQLGVEAVVFDTYLHDRATLEPASAWALLRRLAAEVIDPARERLR
jgi:probable F420-dependent oxidoreductase